MFVISNYTKKRYVVPQKLPTIDRLCVPQTPFYSSIENHKVKTTL